MSFPSADKIYKIIKENEQLQSTLASKEAEVGNLEEKISDCQDVIEQQEIDLASKEERIRELDWKIADNSQRLKEAQAELSKLSHSNTARRVEMQCKVIEKLEAELARLKERKG